MFYNYNGNFQHYYYQDFLVSLLFVINSALKVLGSDFASKPHMVALTSAIPGQFTLSPFLSLNWFTCLRVHLSWCILPLLGDYYHGSVINFAAVYVTDDCEHRKVKIAYVLAHIQQHFFFWVSEFLSRCFFSQGRKLLPPVTNFIWNIAS